VLHVLRGSKRFGFSLGSEYLTGVLGQSLLLVDQEAIRTVSKEEMAEHGIQSFRF
jgi:hypothetical protein